MDIRLKWYYRLGFLLLLFIVLFIFIRLQQLWLPVLRILVTALIPFIVGAFITYLLHPVIERLHQSGLHRGIAVFIIYTMFFGGLGFAIYKGIPAIIHQLRDLADNAPFLTNKYRDMISTVQSKTDEWPINIQSRVESGIDAVEQRLNKLLTTVLNSLVRILNSIVIIALIPFISFYMLKDFTQIKKAVWYITPRKWRQDGVLFLRDVNTSLGGYIRGQLLVCFSIGAISSIAFWIFDLRYPLLLGIIVGVTDVIPYFGPVIGAIPALLIASTISSNMVVITIIIIIVLQFIEGNILSPLIVGKSLHMHPLFIMFALLLGGEVGGVLGLIVAVPVLAVIKVGLVHARKHFGKKTNFDPANP